MKVKDLLEGVKYQVLQGTEDIDIDYVSWDSRKVKPNSLFICVKCRNVDVMNLLLMH